MHGAASSSNMKVFTISDSKTTYVALSFDDGYLSHLTIARLLKRIGVKATFYVITHLKVFEDKLLLTAYPEYIQEIARLGHEIGSHTCTHPDLTNLPRHRLKYELKESKRFLEDIVGKEILGIAYPYGYFNSRVISVASIYYYYARSAAVYRIEDVYNIRPLSRYIISALTIHHLPKLPIKMLNKHETPHPVIFAHNVNLLKVVSLILSLKLLGARFITVKELVELLMRKGIID